MDQDQNPGRDNQPRPDRRDNTDRPGADGGKPRFSRSNDRPDSRNSAPPRFGKRPDDKRSNDRTDSEPRFGRPRPAGGTARFGPGNDRPTRPDGDRRPGGTGRNDGENRNAGAPRFGRSTDDRRNSAPHRSNDRRDSPDGTDRRSAGPPRFGRTENKPGNDRPRFARPNDRNRSASDRPDTDRPRPPRFEADRPRFDRKDGDRPRFERSDTDRRNSNPADRDAPRFGRPDADRQEGRGPARPNTNRFDNDDRRNSRPDRRSDDRPDTDRRDGSTPSFRPRPANADDQRRESPGFRPRPRSADADEQPRFPRRNNDNPEPSDERRPVARRDDRDADQLITDPIQAERPADDRPRFDRREERSTERDPASRFARSDDRPDNRRAEGTGRGQDRFVRSDDRRDAGDRPSDRRDAGSRSPFGRPPARPGVGRPIGERPPNPRFDRERPDNRRDDDRNSPPIDERKQDSRDRKVGRFDRAPDYNFDRMQERVPARKRGETGPKRERTYADDGLLRLNRYIANAGVCSRREADDLIARGDVSVNGKVVVEMGYKVKSTDVVRYGSRVLNPEKLVYVLLNKPKDYITTTDDPQERQTVMDLVADAGPYRIYPVGRLDRNTTGLLLLTNDGELADKLTHPSHQVKKIYQAEIDKPISEEHFQLLREGFELEDGPVKPDDVGIVTPDAQVIGIEIHSGRNRIVRRMFEHLGYDVTKLDRTVYATLTKKDLPRGKWRFLEPKEVVKLKYLQ